MKKVPLFLTNEDWFEEVEGKIPFVVKDDAPQEAKDSYDDYVAMFDEDSFIE